MATNEKGHHHHHHKESQLKGSTVASCAICWQPYTKNVRAPITLRCGHTFCQSCIDSLGRGKTHLQCGSCRKKTWLSSTTLVKNYQFTELMEKASLLAEDPPIEAVARGDPVRHQPRMNNTPARLNHRRSARPRDATIPGNQDEQMNQQPEPTGNQDGQPNQREQENGEITEESAQVLNVIREAMGTLNDSFEDLTRMAVDYQGMFGMLRISTLGNFREFYRQVRRIFKDLDEMGNHQLRDSVREIFYRNHPRLARRHGHMRHGIMHIHAGIADVWDHIERLGRRPYPFSRHRDDDEWTALEIGEPRGAELDVELDEDEVYSDEEMSDAGSMVTVLSIGHEDTWHSEDEIDDGSSFVTSLEIGVAREEFDETEAMDYDSITSYDEGSFEEGDDGYYDSDESDYMI